MTPPLVVLTPVRNESWILERFLAVTSRVADLIVVADQGSTDDSREICRRFPKVHLIENPAAEYDEGGRQRLLLQTARALVPGEKVLLALDADEIVAADAPGTPGWQAMRAAAPGTVLCFEKPDLWHGTDRCVRFPDPWPLGYVDDGAGHGGVALHSIRLPTPPGAPHLELADVKVLHFGLVHPERQAAKSRYYSALENLRGTSPLYRRRFLYAHDRDWTAAGRLELAPREWLAGWEECGIDLRDNPEEELHWQDVEVLRLFARHGARRFWLDDLWTFDWEACRRAALEGGLPETPAAPVSGPPWPVHLAGRALDLLYRAWRSLR
jgi:glycosyltransferase involved in cell wall biosynthesis